MAHEVETMFYVREAPWHGLGTMVENALDSASALKTAGLDWQVVQRPIHVDGVVADEYRANVRDSDKKILGIVGKDYQIVQNQEAFAFTDQLLGNDGVRYETAGSLQGGKRVWMLAKMKERQLLGDILAPYLLFFNGHDGRNAVRVAVTPVRVVCQNTLNLALQTADRSWATIHIGRLEYKLEEAKRTLGLANSYINELEQVAEKLYQIKIDENRLHDLVIKVFPLPADKRRHTRVYELQKEFLTRYYKAPDLENYRGTGWGFVNAVSDLVNHTQPKRQTATFKENRFARVTAGIPELDRAVRILIR